MATIEDATKSLQRMQAFDPAILKRESDLGVKNFAGVLKYAQRLIDLYKRLSPAALQDFPPEILDQVKGRADSDYQLFDQIRTFDPDRTTAERDTIIKQVEQSYSPTFTYFHPLIAYSLHRSADFQALDAQARAALQSINDRIATQMRDLEKTKTDADAVLESVRKTAAEGGVTQQAFFFKEAADQYEADANRWRTITIWVAVGAGLFALLSLGLHKIPFIAPANGFESAQLAISKILVFGVLSFVVFLSARSFLAQKHNAVVNRHRQQALQTYQALVDSAADTANRDIVLTHAASCIFAPQATGY